MDVPGILMVATGRFTSPVEGTVLPRQQFYARDLSRAEELEAIGCARRIEEEPPAPLADGAELDHGKPSTPPSPTPPAVSDSPVKPQGKSKPKVK